MISVDVVRDKTTAVVARCERDSSAPSVVSRLTSSVFRRERCHVQIDTDYRLGARSPNIYPLTDCYIFYTEMCLL